MPARRLLPLAHTTAIALALAGCAHVSTWSAKSAALPVKHEMVRGQLVIRSDDPLPEDQRLIDELVAQRGELLSLLQLPPSKAPINVYLFSTDQQFKSFLRSRYPDLPDRRAFFVDKGETSLEVYAQWGDRVAEDLRHEVTHGYLHSIVPQIPLWLDEGLAEYFEVPRGGGGVNRPHLQHLAARLQEGWQPNLPRLEALSSPADMDQIEYAESWAWVHLLLNSRPEQKKALQEYLREVKQQGASQPLSARVAALWPRPEEIFASYVRRLASQPATTARWTGPQ